MIRCGSGRAPAAAPQRPPASVAMRAGFVAALLHGAQVAGQPTCLNDCSLNGVCQHGACVCDPPWHGTDCAVLDILPSDARGGAIYGVSPRVGSWGGNVLHVGGKFHLYVAEFAGEDCGMVSWRSNSQIRHAMSDTIDGAARALGCRPSCRHQQCAKIVFLNALVLDSLQPIHLGGS